MFTKKFGAKELYFLGFLVLVTGLSLSKFMIGLSQFLLFAGWLWSGNFPEKFRQWYNNKTLLLFVGIFLMHIAGLIITRDFTYAMHDIRIKLPLLVFPLLISTGPHLDRNDFYKILWVFILSNFIGSIVSIFVLLGLTDHPVGEVRDISIFTSHIRFGLLICFAIFILGYFLYYGKEKYSIWKKTGIIILMLWFMGFLVILESVTGIGTFLITSLILLIYHIYFNKRMIFKVAFTFLFLCICTGMYLYVNSEIRKYYQINKTVFLHPELKTRQGNLYEHIPEATEYENGNPVWMYVCKSELKASWSKRSKLPYEGNDKRGQMLLNTLVRFLTSKGFRKDEEGVQKLSDDEIRSIENGVANVNYQGMTNFSGRIREIIWEYDHYARGGNPSGHSVVQRWEYWKTGMGIVSKNAWTGVGTGNVEQAFLHEYYENKSPLSMRWRLRTHNQYLTFAIAFGLPGLAYFLFVMIYILFKDRRYKDYLFSVCWIILCVSMLSEDTLETQAGVSFFAFFNSLFLFKTNWVDR
jgi:hypothetical protein